MAISLTKSVCSALNELEIDTVNLYVGDGAYADSVVYMQEMLTEISDKAKLNWTCRRVEKMEPDHYDPKSTLVFLPGGNASTYVKTWGEQFPKVRQFIKNGGRMLTSCGGSYLCARESDYNGLKRRGPDERLCLLSGKMTGPAMPYYGSKQNFDFHHGAVVVKMNMLFAKCMLSGGGSFVPDDDPEYPSETLATYEKLLVKYKPDDTISGSAITKSFVGKGAVIASGVHFGYGAEHINLAAYSKCFPEHYWQKIQDSLIGSRDQRIIFLANLLLHFCVSGEKSEFQVNPT
jgi:glutamine amidotransferase-like uncharacterized protein